MREMFVLIIMYNDICTNTTAKHLSLLLV